MILSEMELDVLKEAFNVGAGKAAASLEQLVTGEHELHLSVPEVMVVSIDSLTQLMGKGAGEHCSGVVQSFLGPFNGSAVLIYSEEESLEMVRALLGQNIPLSDLPVMRAEALQEIGNIVLNSTLGGISQLLEIELETGLPELKSGTSKEIFVDGAGYGDSDSIIYLRMCFSLSHSNLDGHIGLTLDVGDELALRDCLAGYLSKAFGI